jgi:hypothetical protein
VRVATTNLGATVIAAAIVYAAKRQGVRNRHGEMAGVRGPFASPAAGDQVAERTAEGRHEAFADLAPRDPGHADEVRDLISLGDFLAPEMHCTGGIDEAAAAVREWVDDDVAMIEEAETVAWNQHRDYSAEILHRARLLATVTQ